MAEQIISPGVFTRENDLSFLPQGVGQIGAAIIWPTVKGPAFVPTVVRSFAEYERRFGPLSPETYVPQTVREYLKNAGSVTVCRVLAGTGYSFTYGATPGKTSTLGIVAGTEGGTTATFASGNFKLHGSYAAEQEVQITVGGTEYRFIFATVAGGIPEDSSPVFYVSASTHAAGDSNNNEHIGATMTELAAAINAANIGVTAASGTFAQGGFQLTASVAGPNGNSISVDTGSGADMFDVSVQGIGDSPGTTATLGGGAGASGGVGVLLGLLYPSKATDNATAGLQNSTITGETNLASTFNLKLSGSAVHGSGSNVQVFSGSTVNPSSTSYIFDILGDSPDNSKTSATDYDGIPGYTFLNFKNTTKHILATGSHYVGYGAGTQYNGLGNYAYGANVGSGSNLEIVTQSADVSFTAGIGTEEYNFASTPYIQGQIAMGQKDLFRVCTLDHGKHLNKQYKLSIANFKEPADINGVQQYSQFSVILRRADDEDKTPLILEQFNNVTLDPNSPRFISRVIGDRYPQYNEALNKVELLGNYPNNSKYIRIETSQAVTEGSLSPKQTPKGFAAVSDPFKASAFTDELGVVTSIVLPSASYEGLMTTEDSSTAPVSYNSKGYLGFKFGDKEPDNLNWMNPVPSSPTSNLSGKFSVENHFVHPSSSITWKGSLSASIDTSGIEGPTKNELKFSVPFQGGDDGLAPNLVKHTGTNITAANMNGFNLSSTTAAGYTAYKKALDILANQDEYDINMLAMPGVIHSLHPSVTNAGVNMCEERGDVFYVMDLDVASAAVSTAVTSVGSLDSNFAAVYYPWVKVLDDSINKPVLVPPSVIVPGAIAASDRIGAEWFAPAGLNRGILGNVLEAKVRLNQAERDTLYDAKINPIATFPATGVCIWGQKTLQERSTALDRINVRRLLITLKKFIASSSKYLVFEQNTLQTRTRFLNIVSPYLENIQQRQGLYAFRVVMDESNNTPDVVDRNQLVGAVYLQPTKTAEFIILDFNVLPTGATFPG